jgi:dihydrofolate synthase / folylpolyglutamate synthase
VRAPIRIAGEDWTATEERGRLVYQDDAGLLDLPAPKLNGRHQFENAGLAIAALRAIDKLALAPAAFEGIAKAEWPARMQRLASGRLAALVPPGGELWLDGGHNPDGGRVIANALADLEERVSRPLVLIVGMLANKDSTGFLRNFAGLARRVVTVPIPEQENASPAAALAEAARAIGLPAQESTDLETALAAIASFDPEERPRILITGSLYLAGAALALNGTPPE